MSGDMIRSMLYPILAALLIAIYAGGLGVIFMLLYGDPEAHFEAGQWLVVALGTAITVGVPVVAYLLQRKYEG